jgi:tRNA1(Val) A37 N6-methylase TrmN6
MTTNTAMASKATSVEVISNNPPYYAYMVKVKVSEASTVPTHGGE